LDSQYRVRPEALIHTPPDTGLGSIGTGAPALRIPCYLTGVLSARSTDQPRPTLE
jgi:hypothetical protein